jgi:hypothetical protein
MADDVGLVSQLGFYKELRQVDVPDVANVNRRISLFVFCPDDCGPSTSPSRLAMAASSRTCSPPFWKDSFL